MRGIVSVEFGFRRGAVSFGVFFFKGGGSCGIEDTAEC
jgi:hypothetical protein